MILEYNGQMYEIENWDEFKHTLLDAIGTQLVFAAESEMLRMKLWDNGSYAGGNSYVVKGDEVILENSAPYAVYLEYGTFDYFKTYGLNSFPVPGYPAIPKKKEIGRKAREKLPAGMQPFAPYRRILYNENKMKQVIETAVRVASK